MSNKDMSILGICLGASSISLVGLNRKNDNQKPECIFTKIISHDGNPQQSLLDALKDINISDYDRVVATGRKFRTKVDLTSIPEPEAVELAFEFVKPKDLHSRVVVSAGGETFMVYVFDKNGRIMNVLTGNKCASGTGEFFLQQLRRMGLGISDIEDWADVQEPHAVSGRCSVFCKSDCTHATNKGVPKIKVTSGLCQMMAKKILELLHSTPKENVIMVGGTAQNKMIVGFLREELPDLIIPKEAPYFEALGAALWGFDNETKKFPELDKLICHGAASFASLPALAEHAKMVEFKETNYGTPKAGDEFILGLDVGSTTTKAILLRTSDDACCARIYLRTNGDPIEASRNCYHAIAEQIEKNTPLDTIKVIGLGVCGSGRQVAGLHALTDGIINEIIAHAKAAVFYDPAVDTLFEIGGQDAKYTYVTNSVPSDYAMNEACSAGTGSFLEESALETLGIQMEEIAEIALKGHQPPNFNDQCAAFIASDIKNAVHEGTTKEDIVAGLVYSICMNYTNRVKGNRPVGNKIFMQGGVCYNKAVPLAMAGLVGKNIVVPPDPGLMGAFGAALEIKDRINSKMMEKQNFDLDDLVNREIKYGKSFICHGGKEKCDRKCTISMLKVAGQNFPFGGACNRYYNMRHSLSYDMEILNKVVLREAKVFSPLKDESKIIQKNAPIVGISRSFLMHTYFPLYHEFFSQLGLKVVVPTTIDKKGIDRCGAAFCYPVEIAHGLFENLIQESESLDYIFLPHIQSVPRIDEGLSSQACPFVQGEPFYINMAFSELLREKHPKVKLLTPFLQMALGLEKGEEEMIKMAKTMGFSEQIAKSAFAAGLKKQYALQSWMLEEGQKVLDALANSPDQIGIVVLGRPYNSLTSDANMGISHKLASRGAFVIPLDFLPLNSADTTTMYWAMGQRILAAAQFAKQHPQLFCTYITNFSCGPDSFLLGYMRGIMGRKPSLTLELDSHTADAGVETRIEAFLDIVYAYRKLEMHKIIDTSKKFNPAKIEFQGKQGKVRTSNGELLDFKDKRITFVFPSMGEINTAGLAAVFKSMGFNAYPSPPADEEILKLGRANSSCKECLPLILTTGMLLDYVNKRREDEVVIYFMPTASGPCRFGQYYVFMEDLIKRQQIPNVGFLSLSAENGYAGLPGTFSRRAWWAVVTGDAMEDIRSMLLVNSVDKKAALIIFWREWEKVLKALEVGKFATLISQLQSTSEVFAEIKQKKDPKTVPVISLIGEIYVRRENLARRYIVERLADKGFATVCAPVGEWIHYTEYLVQKDMTEEKTSRLDRFGSKVKQFFMLRFEAKIKNALSSSNLISNHLVDVDTLLKTSAPFVSENLTGEVALTIGSALCEIGNHACGVITIGPFGCMPNRMSEAILNKAMTGEIKGKIKNKNEHVRAVLSEIESLPFLAIESDGSPFPQLIEAKLETFCLRAQRLHEIVNNRVE